MKTDANATMQRKYFHDDNISWWMNSIGQQFSIRSHKVIEYDLKWKKK